MNKYLEHYWKIEKYKQNFEKMLNIFQTIENPKEKFDFALYLTNYFVFNNIGYYTSAVLERFLVD